MTLYMPPLARKKRVPERYNPDSFRVISTNAEDDHPKFPGDNKFPVPDREQLKRGVALPDIYNRSTQVLPKEVPDYRVHRPHPNNCGFLRHNVRILNEPICSVYTGETHDEQNLWWPSRTSDEPLQIPPKTKDTIYREGYMRDSPFSARGFTRHEANPNKNAAHGVVPVNFLGATDGQKRIFQEKISFEHQYNSRSDPNYPIRNKFQKYPLRHGSFVWDQASKEQANKFVQQQSHIESNDRAEVKPFNGATLDTHPVIPPPEPNYEPTSRSPPKSPPASTTQSPKRITPPATELVSCSGGSVSKEEKCEPKTNNGTTTSVNESGEK
ncbi:uncharacterized protein [Mytilus edulis]|uniref:uncharacterized protein isoform X1 n=1 Tax=Mytilus edulis TaxID=6550 RepID=UPI0039EF6AD9